MVNKPGVFAACLAMGIGGLILCYGGPSNERIAGAILAGAGVLAYSIHTVFDKKDKEK